MRSLFTFHPDALVLDLRDSRDGKELFQLLYKVSELPIVVLGDARQPAKAVWFLEEGAADYLVRPVPHNVLSARISALLRRKSVNGKSGPIQAGILEIDPERHVVLRDGRSISLTPIEFRLLHVLAEHAGSACGHRMLLEQVWGEDFRHCFHYLRLYIGYLRNKLENDPRNPKILATEWGVGYRLVAGRRGEMRQQAGVRPRIRFA